MRLQFSDVVAYTLYITKRESLDLYYFKGDSVLYGFEKGYYRCEKNDDCTWIVYATYRGTMVSNHYFEHYFKKPSKLRLFLHKHFIWL